VVDVSITSESPEQAQAFQVYYAMGSDRSYDKVGQALGKHINTIKKWSKKFGWQERIATTNGIVVSGMNESLVKKTLETKEQSKMISQMLRDNFQKDVEAGEIKVRSINDFVAIDKHDLLVRGEATERKEVRSVEIKGEVKDILAYIGKKVEEMGIDAEFEVLDEGPLDAEEISV